MVILTIFWCSLWFFCNTAPNAYRFLRRTVKSITYLINKLLKMSLIFALQLKLKQGHNVAKFLI